MHLAAEKDFRLLYVLIREAAYAAYSSKVGGREFEEGLKGKEDLPDASEVLILAGL